MDTHRTNTGQLGIIYSLESVSKTYKSEKSKDNSKGTTALKDISLDIASGEFLVIMGKSGSGKSTLLHILGGLDVPTAGQVKIYPEQKDSSSKKKSKWRLQLMEYLKRPLIRPVRKKEPTVDKNPGQESTHSTGNSKSNHNEKHLNSMNETQRARLRASHIGMIYQSFHLIPTLTARENVALPLLFKGIPPKTRIRKAEKLLQELELEHRMAHLPGQLSGGELQRVAIARALVMEPGILLADEPTGNLDTPSENEILDLLKNLHSKKNLTIVLVTHNEKIKERYADRYIILEDGQIKEVKHNNSSDYYRLGKQPETLPEGGQW